jgi:glucan phosphorylase
MGRFSSDRTVLEYAQNIWGARPLSPQAGKA